MNDVRRILTYWRTSLADGALGEGTFTQADRKRFFDVPNEARKSGVLPGQMVERLFRGQASAKAVGIRFWPLVTARKSSHGAARAGGLPEIVAPVVTEAVVDRAGRITPMRNVLARDLLTPLATGEFAIGSVDALDAFLTGCPLPEMMIEDSWKDYFGHCRRMLDAVAPGWPEGDADYRPVGTGLLELTDDANATVRGILDLYDKLLTDNPEAPLLAQIAQPRHSAGTPDPRIEEAFARRLGHSNVRFPLRDLAGTAAYAVARARRKKVEMLFAHLKRHLRLRRLRLRGLAGATEEFLLAATAQNLKRLVKLTTA